MIVKALATALLISGLAAATFLGQTAASSLEADARSIEFPVHLEYTLDYVADESGNLMRVEFVLDVRNWSNWRQEITCCGDLSGYVQEQRPDGSTWSGYETWVEGLIETNRGASDGAVPGPDFSQGRPYNVSAISGMPGVTVEDEVGRSQARLLGLSTSDVLAYRYVGGTTGVESLEPELDFDSLNVVHTGLRVPIYVEERQNGNLVRRLSLKVVESLS